MARCNARISQYDVAVIDRADRVLPGYQIELRTAMQAGLDQQFRSYDRSIRMRAWLHMLFNTIAGSEGRQRSEAPGRTMQFVSLRIRRHAPRQFGQRSGDHRSSAHRFILWFPKFTARPPAVRSRAA